MTKKLTSAHLTILKNVVEFGSWGVYADEIPECGDLIRRGYVCAESDYEGPRMYPTDAGRRYLRSVVGEVGND